MMPRGFASRAAGTALALAALAASPTVSSASGAPSLRDGVEPIPAVGPAEGAPGIFPATAVVMYDNLSGNESLYYAGQGGHEALDDVHGTGDGDLAAVTFRYFDPGSPAGAGAYVSVYSNPGGFDAGATLVAGPVFVGGLVAGSPGSARVIFPGVEPVEANLWVGVRFTSSTAGLLISETPSTGSSHDYYREDGSLFFFGGDPVANFSIRVELGTPTGVGERPSAMTGLRVDSWPNPMERQATVLVSLDRADAVSLSVIGLKGQLVTTLAEGRYEAGRHRFSWNGTDRFGRPVPGGVYYLRARTTGDQAISTVLVIR